MDTQAYLKHFVSDLHARYRAAIQDLSDEKLYWRPAKRSNHIAFVAWHWVRTEDNVVQFALQRKPTIWQAKELHERWGLPPIAQGTGMEVEEAVALRLPSVADFLAYAEEVWAAGEAYLEAAGPEEFSRIAKVIPFGEIPVAQAIGQTVIAHGNQHLGELWLLREMQGLAGVGF